MSPESRSIVSVAPPIVEGVFTVKKEPLTQREYEVLKQFMPSVKYLLILKLLRGTGLRIAEILRTTPRHLQTDGLENWIVVTRGKQATKAPEQIRMFLHPELGIELRGYIQGQQIKLMDPIFKIRARQVERVFKVASTAHLSRAVHPHEIRHLFIKWQIDNGMPVEMVAKLVGHSDTRTTLKYYYDLDPVQLAKIARTIPI